MNKKKCSRAKHRTSHKYFDGSELLTFLSENPEAANTLVGLLGGGSKGIGSSLFGGVTNLIDTIEDVSSPERKSVEEVMGLPTQFRYDLGGMMGPLGAVNTGADLVAGAIKDAQGIDTTEYQDKAKAFGNQQFNVGSNEDLLNQWSSVGQLNHVTTQDITGKSDTGRVFGAIGDVFGDTFKGAMAGASIDPTIGTLVGAGTGLISSITGKVIGANKTKKNVQALNDSIDVANNRIYTSLGNAAENLERQKQANMLANYSAEGGKIHIKPSKRGTFTAAASKHGMGVQEFASRVLANPENYSPAMRKKANFARNAAKWHADGGLLMSDEFTNGVILVNQGGTHENNPHEGVQMGIAPDGAPNLVEEGEAIFNDYVFSNRLRVPKEVRNKYKLRGPEDMTFAEAFREAQKESAERPNDPISKDGLDNIAMVLARTQEAVRAYNHSNKKAKGGHLYSGTVPPYDDMPENPYTKGTYDWAAANDAIYNGYTKGEWTPTWNPDLPSGDYKLELEGPTQGLQDGLAAFKNADVNEKDVFEIPAKWKLAAKNADASVLRLADPLANFGAVMSDMMGLTNTPTHFDYIPGYQSVGFTPLGDYMPETHFDTRYAANQAAQQAAATRNAIMQSSAPSRTAALLAADFNAQIANGDLLRQGAMQDYERMLKAKEFNRATNQYNSEMGFRAGAQNVDNRLKYAQALLQQAKMNDEASTLASSARAQNLSNLAESTANMGREAEAKDWLKMLADAGVFGTLPTATTAAKGGKLRKRKKGLTY